MTPPPEDRPTLEEAETAKLDRKIVKGRIVSVLMRRYREIERAGRYDPEGDKPFTHPAADYREGARLSILLCISDIKAIFENKPITFYEMVEPPVSMPEWFP